MSTTLAEEQLGIYDSLMSVRKAERDTDWQTIAQYALPQDSNITTKKTEAVSGWTDRVYDTTVIHAMEVLAAGLFNWWTPPNQPWAEFDIPEELKGDDDENENDNDDAVKWLGRASDKAMRELGRSNFYMVKATGDLGLAVFATDLIIVDDSDSGKELFNFVHCKIGTYVIEENYCGIVDTVRREIEMTFRQIEQKFGASGDNIPEKMREQSKGKAGTARKWKVLHCIFPREDSDRLPKAKTGKNKAIASVFIAMDFKEVIRVSGYDENPILCRRFKKWATAYGYGPGYLALPDARQVNYVQQYLDANAELHADPRVLIPDNLDGDVDLRAGGVTTYDSSHPEAKPEEWLTGSEYKLGLEMQEGRRQAIRDACFVDAFKLLNTAPLLDKEMTAYEISQRQAEQLQGLTAIDARTIPEFINPLMARVFGIMFRAGKIKDPPDVLIQKDAAGNSLGLVVPEVVVTSRFNDALRALKNRGAEETFRFLLPMAEIKPEVFDLFDMDKTVRGYARNSGMAADDLRREKGKDSVQQIRAARQAQVAAQQQAALAEQLSATTKNLGGSPPFVQDAAKQQMSGAAA